MDILKWKCISITFFCIKADRNALHGSDIVYRTSLVKISQCDMSGLLVNIDRCDRSRHFLDQCQSVFQIFFIGAVNKFL